MKLSAGCGLEVFEESLDCCLTKIPKEPALVLEEYPQHLGDGEDDLAVGDVEEKFFPHPLAPLLKPFCVARWAKSSSATREVEEKFRTTVRTADAGKPAARVAAVKIALNDFLDDRPEEPVLSLETALVVGQELVKVMEEHPVEHGTFRMPGTVHSCHSRGS